MLLTCVVLMAGLLQSRPLLLAEEPNSAAGYTPAAARLKLEPSEVDLLQRCRPLALVAGGRLSLQRAAALAHLLDVDGGESPMWIGDGERPVVDADRDDHADFRDRCPVWRENGAEPEELDGCPEGDYDSGGQLGPVRRPLLRRPWLRPAPPRLPQRSRGGRRLPGGEP